MGGRDNSSKGATVEYIEWLVFFVEIANQHIETIMAVLWKFGVWMD